jgi:excisionase family DNA binding protein
MLSQPILDADAVAQALGITRRHVQRLVAERRIPYLKVGRFVRFDPAALDVWLDEQRIDVVHGRSGGRSVRPLA